MYYTSHNVLIFEKLSIECGMECELSLFLEMEHIWIFKIKAQQMQFLKLHQIQ